MVILQKQSNRHDPANGVWGDCHRTAYAMALGIPKHFVPHVMDNGASAEDANNKMEIWLTSIGLKEVSFPVTAPTVDNLLECWASFAKNVPFVLGGQSRNTTNHSVCVMNGEIFDPSLDESGIVGPCDDGYYWVTFFTKDPLEGLADKLDPPDHMQPGFTPLPHTQDRR